MGASVPHVAANWTTGSGTGEASIASLFRYLSTSRLVSIAQVAGRVRAAGSEFVLACDMRFAAREAAIFSQMEAAFGLIPGAGGALHLPRLLGRARALEVMLTAGDYDADLAALCELPTLRWLRIGGPGFSDAGLRQVEALKGLQALTLLDCPDVTAGAVERLQKALPGCQVDVHP